MLLTPPPWPEVDALFFVPGIYILAYYAYNCLILYRALCIYIPLRSYTSLRRVCQRTRWWRREAFFLCLRSPLSPLFI